VDSLSEFSASNIANQNQRVVEKIITKGNRGYIINTINNQPYISRFTIGSSSISFGISKPILPDEKVNGLGILSNGDLVTVGYKIVDNESRTFLKIYSSHLGIRFIDYETPGYFNDVVVLSDTTFMLTGSFGETQLFGGRVYNQYYEQQGDIMEDLESDQIFQIENNGYLLLKNQTITKLDNDFQIEHSADFGSYGSMIDMEEDDENVFLLYQKPEEPPMVLKLNLDLDVEDAFFVEDEKFRANDMAVSETELGIGGYLIPTIPFNNTSNLYSSTSGYFKTFSKEGISASHDFDLEIFEVTVEDHEKDFSCNEPEKTSSYQLDLKNIKLGLVNHGSKTINNVELFMEILGVELCVTNVSIPKYHLQQDELSLLRLEPGDTLRWRIFTSEFPQRIEDTTSINLCVWHTTVENKKDVNPANDYFCGEVTLETGYVEPPIIEPTEGEYLMFPNPLNDVMTVSLAEEPFDPTVIEFYDYMGRELDLKYFIAARAKYKEFDVSQLPSGFYFMKISNDIFEDMIRVYVN